MRSRRGKNNANDCSILSHKIKYDLQTTLEGYIGTTLVERCCIANTSSSLDTIATLSLGNTYSQYQYQYIFVYSEITVQADTNATCLLNQTIQFNMFKPDTIRSIKATLLLKIIIFYLKEYMPKKCYKIMREDWSGIYLCGAQ